MTVVGDLKKLRVKASKIADAVIRFSPQYWIAKAVLGGYNPPDYLGEDPPTPFGVIENYLYREGVPRSARHAARIIEKLTVEGYDIRRRVQVTKPPPDFYLREYLLDEQVAKGPW